ncbi:50S ribosomal protein L11 methyltransferase [Candidatus Leptofilum sp.]|uniref:50S ribosomal protein L11 methyltransferase n=1 Tax=Candidatus Leptofilum sp. TaxID=3241576 RepID=UPI003B594747
MSATYWLEVSVITDGEGAEAVAEVLRPFAHNDGVVLEQLGDESNPAHDALETAVTVKIYLPESEDTPQQRQRIEEILYHMGRLYPLPPPTFRKLKDEDWANAWKAHYHPFRIGSRIWIQPSWIEARPQADTGDFAQPDDVVLVLDPGMAFGTGLHPTTQMCLQALENVVQPDYSVLDVGTGSGILSIAAAKLGAGRVRAFDTDALAVKTTHSNAAQNDIDGIHIHQGVLADVPLTKWDVVVVNILAHVIVTLLEKDRLLDYVALDGKLILSGVIEEQLEAVETAVTQAGGQVTEKIQVRDWICLSVTPKPT